MKLLNRRHQRPEKQVRTMLVSIVLVVNCMMVRAFLPRGTANARFQPLTTTTFDSFVLDAVGLESEAPVTSLFQNSSVPSSSGTEVSSIRPFHQQWWPVAAVSSLKKDRPNSISVLGKSLVAFYGSEGWTVLDDQCSHRFAPLSEGRLVTVPTDDECRLQCAYHGWEFDSAGICTHVPQEPNAGTTKARAVQRYPVREEITMLWVWMDPSSFEQLQGNNIPLPINSYLRQRVKELGPSACFQRDLPYGMEILGENLLDLSHLPFAHHSVGGLSRTIGGPLPTRFLTKQERIDSAQWEYEFSGDNEDHGGKSDIVANEPVLPVFQAEIVDAASHDPLHIPFALSTNSTAEELREWNTTIGYYEPCHVRYRRVRGTSSSSGVELFFCPTSVGRSRVFLFNTIRRQPTSVPPPPGSSLRQKVKYLMKLSTWKDKAFEALIRRILSGTQGHLMSHSIFDGDGIFLHKQGNRMKQSNLTYRDYSTPSSADILLNAYRRVLDQAAQRTRDLGLDDIAESVVGNSAYGDDIPRSIMLDRYNTHTKFCPLCLNALQKCRKRKSQIEILQTALIGCAGASVVVLSALASVLLTGKHSLSSLILAGIRGTALTLIGSILGSFVIQRTKRKMEKQINSFLFEDYVHAEKN